MSAAAPSFLFVPVSGPGGAGEYYRSLAVARGLERRYRGCRIRFVLNRHAPYTASSPYGGPRLDDSPTRSNALVIACIRDERPDVVVFDSSGRLAQYAAARDAGAGVVYVSSRPKTRWKGFRWRRMRVIDQHWIAQPRQLGGAPGPYEKLKLGLMRRPQLVFLDALHDEVDPAAVAALQSRLGLERGKYVVACPGGGGDFGEGIDAVRIFFEAVQKLRSRLSIPVVAVLGERYAGSGREPLSDYGDANLASLPNGTLLGLVHDAAVACVNGGSLLLQSMTQGVPLVAAPIAGDQSERIRRSAALGCVRAATLESGALATAVEELLADPTARTRMQQCLARVGLRNGVEVAVDAVERLLQRQGPYREVR
jgi:hypothetical protein